MFPRAECGLWWLESSFQVAIWVRAAGREGCGDKALPLEKVSIGGAKVVIAAAVTAPTPGIVVNRRA